MPILPLHPSIYYGLLVFCLLLGIGLLALAWQRSRQRQRLARMLASAVAAGALWLSAFPPLRHLPTARAEAILLTAGYAPDTLRQLLRQLGAGTPVWTYGELKIPAKAKPLGSLLTLAEQRPSLRRLHILGNGLPAAELPSLGLTVRLHPSAPFVGLHTAFWPNKLALGGTLLVIVVAASRKMDLKDVVLPETFNSQTGMVEGLGKILYRDYVLPFELISVLFFVAMVGAVMLGKREAGERNF